MSEESFNSAEYGVKQLAEGRILACRILLIAFYILFAAFYCVLFTVIVPLVPLIGILPMLFLAFGPRTWRLVTFDREYALEGGYLIFRNFYKNKKRKELLRVHVCDAEAIFPIEGKQTGEGYDALFDYRGSMKSPDSYMIVFRAEDGKRTAACFEVTAKLARLLHSYNKNTVLKEELRH